MTHPREPLATDRIAAIAGNTKAIRATLLVADLAGQFALQPLVPIAAWAVAIVVLVGVSIASVNQPLVAGDTKPSRHDGALRQWQWRQFAALVIIMVAGVEAATRLHANDAASEGSTLAFLLLFVQVAHSIASRTRREAALGCGVVVAMLAVVAVFSGDVTLLLPVVIGMAAVAVVGALLHRASLLESVDAVAARSTATAVRACIAPVALAAGVGVLALLVMPNSAGMHARGRSGVVGGSGAGSAAGLQRSVGGIGAVGTSTLDLRARGTLSSDPVLSTDATAPQYWQGAIYDQFDGLRWQASTLDYAGLWTSSLDAPSDGWPVQVPPVSAVKRGTPVRSDVVTVLSPAALEVVLAPGVATSYTGPGRVLSDADGGDHLIGGGPAENATYRVTSVLETLPAADLRGAATGPDLSEPRWTALPAVIAPRVGDLALQLTRGARSRFDAVEAVESYLRTHETYDLASPLPARGDDAVDDFVFVSHRGFCEQFATAAVVMLRSAGIPARLVTGYAFGDATSQAGRRIFRVSDAHAWVQVFYPGIGWVSSDPTPAGGAPADSGASTRSVRQRIADAAARAWHRVPGGRLGALLIVCLLLVVGVVAVLAAGRGLGRRRKRARAAALARADGAGPVLRAYLRLEAALASVSPADRSRVAGETLGEFARRLGGLVADPAEVARAMRCLERECYARSSRRPSAAEAAEAAEVFDRLCAATGSQSVVVAADRAH